MRAAGPQADKLVTRGKHNLICDAFIGLDRRPTKEHGICILFPPEEQTPRLVWVPRAPGGLAKSDAITIIMAPETQSVEYSAALSVVPDDDVEAYRDVTLCYTGDFVFNPNLSHKKSLGLATVESRWILSKALFWSSSLCTRRMRTKSLSEG